MLAADPYDDAAAAAVARRVRDAALDLTAAVGDRLAGVKGEVTQAAGTVGGQVAEIMATEGSAVSMTELAAAAAEVDRRAIDRLRKWSKLDFTKGEGEAFEGVGGEVALASGRLAAAFGPLTDPCGERLASARAVVAPLLETVQQRRSAAGLVTFSDQLRSAAGLLAASKGVRREVVAGIDHLLVDEFQDTDDVQCRLVEMLALTGEPSQRPSLFIVGDPKQSIYAWRSADLAAYDDFVTRVVDAGGTTVDLVRNFRSVTPILDEVERAGGAGHASRSPVSSRPFSGSRPPMTDGMFPVWMSVTGRPVEHWVRGRTGDDGVAPEKGARPAVRPRLSRRRRWRPTSRGCAPRA